MKCQMLLENFEQCTKEATVEVRVFSDEKHPRQFCEECAAKLVKVGLVAVRNEGQ